MNNKTIFLVEKKSTIRIEKYKLGFLLNKSKLKYNKVLFNINEIHKKFYFKRK